MAEQTHKQPLVMQYGFEDRNTGYAVIQRQRVEVKRDSGVVEDESEEKRKRETKSDLASVQRIECCALQSWQTLYLWSRLSDSASDHDTTGRVVSNEIEIDSPSLMLTTLETPRKQ